MSLLLILYVVMGFGLDYETLMDSLLNTSFPLTIKHNSPSLILRHVPRLLGKFKYVGLLLLLF